MKSSFPVLLVLLFICLGCTDKADQDIPSDASHLLMYDDGMFSFSYPDWPDAKGHENKDTFLVKTNKTCVFGASRYPMPSSILKGYLEDYLGTGFNGEYAEYVLDAEGTKLNTRTRIVYCDYTTYTLTYSCAGSLDGVDILSQTTCEKRELNTKPKLGLIATPPSNNVSMIYPSIRDAREHGVDVLYWFFAWGDLEKNWTLSDYLIEPMAYEGRTAVTMDVTHSNVLGKYPSRYSSFTDSGFKEDFADFSVDFVKRYEPDYYFVGNEVDEYLWTHREEIGAFREVLRYTRERIHEESPGTKVGFTTTYHDALRNDALDIAQTLADDADIIGYTCHGYHDLFVYDNVSNGVAYMHDLKNVVPGKPYAVVETGWSSSEMLNSSQELQAEYLQEYFDYIDDTDAEFAVWFTMHDGYDCTESAESFLVNLPEVKNNKVFMDAFKEYMCKLGLKTNDGIEKKAWQVWEKNV